MPRFELGDRVQLIGDIARFYEDLVGVVVSNSAYPASVLSEYKVRLADGTEGMFFDFQLYTPPASPASVLFDSSVTWKVTGTRGQIPGRHVLLVSRHIDIHLKITDSPTKTVLGHVTAEKTGMRKALVTVLDQDQPADTVATDDSGEFTLRDVQLDPLRIEIFLPERRILVSL